MSKIFFDHIGDIDTVLKDKKVVVFLDYDGTLTPIVDTPDQAIISDDMKNLVKKMSEVHQIAVVSGRSTDDVKAKVGIEGIYYAGSHGFEIVSPDQKVFINEQVAATKETQQKIFATLTDRLKDIEGVLVEDVKYTVSVHYRLVDEDDLFVVEAAVQATIDKFTDFKRTHGKKVFEVRPDLDWHKGKAVEWILEALKFDPINDVAIYVGDDVTDEDAFSALKENGFGILVSEDERETAARYRVNNTEEVKKVIEYLLSVGGN